MSRDFLVNYKERKDSGFILEEMAEQNGYPAIKILKAQFDRETGERKEDVAMLIPWADLRATKANALRDIEALQKIVTNCDEMLAMCEAVYKGK